MDSRYEKEIEELLSRLGDIAPRESFLQRVGRLVHLRARLLWHAIRTLPNSIPADQLMVTAILCIVAAYFLRFVLPGAARFVGMAGVLLFLAAFFFSFQQVFGGSQGDVRWRGQRINMNDGQPSQLQRFLFWLRRQFRIR